MPRSWIRLALFSILLLVAAGVGLLIVSSRPQTPVPTPIPAQLPDNSETRVEMTPGSASRLYNFSTRRLKLGSETPGFAFAAEIRSADGQTVAHFTNLLQEVQVTLADGMYQLFLTAGDPRVTGAISLDLGSAVNAPDTLDGTAYRAANCRVTNAASSDAIIRSAPAEEYAVLGLLPPNGTLAAIGRTDNDWYTVSYAERIGWIAGGVAALEGDCGALPVVRNPTIPTAPTDAPAFLLQVDRDGNGTFSESISAPGGDTLDTVWVQIVNLDTRPPNNYREFVLMLDCRGTGAEAVRWGSAYGTSLACGTSIVLPFLSGRAQQPIAIQLPAGSHQSYVEYKLNVFPSEAAG